MAKQRQASVEEVNGVDDREGGEGYYRVYRRVKRTAKHPEGKVLLHAGKYADGGDAVLEGCRHLAESLNRKIIVERM